jgi:hypothetical protein
MKDVLVGSDWTREHEGGELKFLLGEIESTKKYLGELLIKYEIIIRKEAQ